MVDHLQRVITQAGNFFGIACVTTNLVAEACRRHDVGPTAATALGRALTGATLLAALLKGEQSVLLRFEGNGPLRKIITEAGCSGWVRGYVAEPHAEVPLRQGRIDVAAALGHAGLLTVTKDIGGPQRYQGTIELYSSEIGEDLAYYLTRSEQTPSTLALGIRLHPSGTIAAAGGFLIQALPPADERLLGRLEERIASLPPVSEMLLAGRGPADILATVFDAIPCRKTAETPLRYQCSCSRDKMQRAILTLAGQDQDDLLQREEGLEVRCEFCRQSYHFSREETRDLLLPPASGPH